MRRPLVVKRRGALFGSRACGKVGNVFAFALFQQAVSPFFSLQVNPSKEVFAAGLPFAL